MSSSIISQQSTGVATESQRGVTSAQEMRGLLFDGNSAAFRNRIINGDMRIVQRTTDSGTVALNNTLVCDRFTNYSFSGTGRVQQVTISDLPGFTYAQRFTVGSAATRHLTTQRVEGFNVLDFPSKNVTMSFYIRGSKSFTFGFDLYVPTSPSSQSYVKNIFVTTSWQRVIINIPMYASLGSYANGNAFETVFNWYPDQTALTSTAETWVSGDKQGITGTSYTFNTANDWVEFTGVSIENGAVSTAFEYRPYTFELALCQRYFDTNYPIGNAVGAAIGDYPGAVGVKDPSTNSEFLNTASFHVTMRAKPVVTLYRPVDGIANTVEEFGNGSKSVTINTNRVSTSGFSSVFVTTSTSGSKMYFYLYTANAEL